MHFARNGMLKHPIPYIGMDAQANLTVGSGEKRLSFRSSENASQTVVTLWLVRYNHIERTYFDSRVCLNPKCGKSQFSAVRAPRYLAGNLSRSNRRLAFKIRAKPKGFFEILQLRVTNPCMSSAFGNITAHDYHFGCS